MVHNSLWRRASAQRTDQRAYRVIVNVFKISSAHVKRASHRQQLFSRCSASVRHTIIRFCRLSYNIHASVSVRERTSVKRDSRFRRLKSLQSLLLLHKPKLTLSRSQSRLQTEPTSASCDCNETSMGFLYFQLSLCTFIGLLCRQIN